MTILELIIGLKMSMIGDKMPWRGSRGPQLLDAWAEFAPAALSFEVSLVAVTVSPLRFLPLPLILEPLVLARGRDVTPALRALTRSLQ